MNRMLFASTKLRLACTILALSLLQGACAPMQRPSPADGEFELTILHVNDTHAHIAGVDGHGSACFDDAACSGGLARIAAAIHQAKAESGSAIALDAGDQFQGTLFYSVNRWPMLAEFDRHMPYDAMTLGNHEFDEGCAELAKFMERLPFPVLAANLHPEKGCPLLTADYRPHAILDVRGQKVAVVGIANSEVVSLSAACPHTLFEETAASLRKTVKKLEGMGVKYIIALTHIGLPADRELARSVDGVDVIVGGHSHSYLGEHSEEGPYPIIERSPSGQPVLIVTAKRAAEYLGELKVKFDEAGTPVAWSGAARPLPPSAARDAAVSALVRKYAGTLDEYRSIPVGVNAVSMPDGMDACRKDDCLSGSLIADAMLEYGSPFGGQIALCNGGSVRAALPSGSVSRGDLLSVMPFGNTLALREITGAQLLSALEHGVSEEGAAGPRLLHTAGLRYTVDRTRPAGSRVISAEIISEKGAARPLDLKARYGIVTFDYLARGGDGYAMLRNGRTVSSPDAVDVTVVEEYLKKHSPLSGPPGERIIRKQQGESGRPAERTAASGAEGGKP